MSASPASDQKHAHAAPGLPIWRETVDLPLAELKEAPWNPNVQDGDTYRHQLESIRRFGFVGPIVVRAEDRLIIAGHHRVRALQDIGHVDSVPCVLVSDLTDDEAKALGLALNRIHGEFEPEALECLVRELSAHEGDWGSIGIDEIELAELLGEDTALGTVDDIEVDAPEEPADSTQMIFDVPAHLVQFVETALARARRHDGINTEGEALVLVCQRALRRTGSLAL